MTPEQVCETLAVTKDWLYDKVAAGVIPGFKLTPNGALRFRESAVEAYIESRESA